jgi:hypothetical protein
MALFDVHAKHPSNILVLYIIHPPLLSLLTATPRHLDLDIYLHVGSLSDTHTR